MADRQIPDDSEAEPLESSGRGRQARFSRGGLIALSIALALFVWFAIDLLLLLFGGLLLGIFLHTLAGLLTAHTPLGHRLALALVVLALTATVVGAGLLFAGQLSEQARELSQRVPQAAERVVETLEQHEWSRWIVDQLRGGDAGSAAANGPAASEMAERAAGALSRLAEFVVAIAVVVFGGVYLAASPAPYIRGVLRLVPIRRRARVGEAMYAVGYTLRWWLFGQLAAMALVGTVMGVGLAFIGVPLAFGLGVLAALFEFIPTVGPVLALVPALLLALVESPQMALYVLILYTFVQTLEGYLFTPLIQERVVHLPPVLTIAVQVLLAWRLGPLGLVVAVPLMAAVLVAVQMLYVKDVLTDRFTLAAEEAGRLELERSGHLQTLS